MKLEKKKSALTSPKQDRRVDAHCLLVASGGGAWARLPVLSAVRGRRLHCIPWLCPEGACSFRQQQSILRFLSGKGMVLRGSENRIQCVT